MNKLEKKLRIFIEKALEKGYYFRKLGENNAIGFVDDAGGCCLLGAVVVGAVGPGVSHYDYDYRNGAAKLLHVDFDVVCDLENGFEHGDSDTAMARLGIKLAKDYYGY